MAVQLQLCVANYHLRSTLTSDDSLQLIQGTGFIVLFQFEHDPFNMCVREQLVKAICNYINLHYS